jgi:lambda repressor-like predicted transcriptional regulator
MAARRIDITGQVFSKLTVIRRAGPEWLCECACGTTCTVRASNLRSGKKKSCGCLNRNSFGDRPYVRKTAFVRTRSNDTHGLCRSAEYGVWKTMKRRCLPLGIALTKYHGDRGIRVCDRWQHFENFLADMGPRPAGHSIDRINNDGNYEPSNCRWVTKKSQTGNRKNTIFVEFEGQQTTLAELAARFGISYNTFAGRFYRGWPVAEIVAQGAAKMKKKDYRKRVI